MVVDSRNLNRENRPAVTKSVTWGEISKPLLLVGSRLPGRLNRDTPESGAVQFEKPAKDSIPRRTFKFRAREVIVTDQVS